MRPPAPGIILILRVRRGTVGGVTTFVLLLTRTITMSMSMRMSVMLRMGKRKQQQQQECVLVLLVAPKPNLFTGEPPTDWASRYNSFGFVCGNPTHPPLSLLRWNRKVTPFLIYGVDVFNEWVVAVFVFSNDNDDTVLRASSSSSHPATKVKQWEGNTIKFHYQAGENQVCNDHKSMAPMEQQSTRWQKRRYDMIWYDTFIIGRVTFNWISSERNREVFLDRYWLPFHEKEWWVSFEL